MPHMSIIELLKRCFDISKALMSSVMCECSAGQPEEAAAAAAEAPPEEEAAAAAEEPL
jgi:hypothetical protein